MFSPVLSQAWAYETRIARRPENDGSRDYPRYRKWASGRKNVDADLPKQRDFMNDLTWIDVR